jgi:membrane-bound serine protease (ClpP class)
MINSIILALYLLGLISAKSAAVFLAICGIGLIGSEFLFPSGVVAFSGLLALYIAYSLQYGQDHVFGAPIGWSVFFGIAFVEAMIAGAFAFLFLRNRDRKAISGAEGMIGHAGEVVEWHGNSGRVRVQGEIWKAVSQTPVNLKKDDKITVESVDNLVLKIQA